MTLKIVMAGACPFPVPQGSQVFMGETARCIAGLGHDVRLVVYGYGNEEPQDPVPVVRAMCPPFAGARTDPGPHWGKPLHDAALLLALRRAARGADAVCAHNYEALIAALLSGRRPVVYFAHNAMADELPYYCATPEAARRAARLGRWFDDTFPRRAARIIVPHRRLAGYLVLRGCDPARVVVVPPPVDLTPFEAPPADNAAVLPPVLYMGNLDAYQNLPLLTAMMARVRAVKPDARLLIASAQPPNLPGAEHLPAPDFETVRRALLDDVIVAVPRLSWSGYPIKMLNAMAAGRPVVACASAAWPITDGLNGLVVADNDAEAFAAAVLRLVEAPKLRRELGRAARETVHRENASHLVARQLERVITEAVDEA
jgi:glycosyltransferase involved in cell wall biosynthesis